MARPARQVSRQRVADILQALQAMWGQATCELDHEDALQLLVASVLCAQTTARKVNEVTPALFARYPDAAALAGARAQDLEAMIRNTGFYRMKATRLIAMARALVERHGGQVPGTLGELARLPGVTRKTANVVLGTWFCVAAGVVVDAHVSRVSRRLGLTRNSDARDIERDLAALVPRERWIDVSNELMWHGRGLCHARDPECHRCVLAPLCPSSHQVGHEPAR